MRLKDVVQDLTKSCTKSLKIKLSNVVLRENRRTVFSAVPKLTVGSKKVVLFVDVKWQPPNQGTMGTLSFFVKEAAGLPSIRGARHALATILVADSAQAFPRLVSGSADKSVAVWDVWTGAQLQRFRGHKSDVTQVLVADKFGQQILLSSSSDKVGSFLLSYSFVFMVAYQQRVSSRLFACGAWRLERAFTASRLLHL
jgi:hypothetical protein